MALNKRHTFRLEQYHIQQPIFYITTCTEHRKHSLDNDAMHEICLEVWDNAKELYGWIVGRYVLMPDHVHFFCTPIRDEVSLSTFVGKWKEWTSKYAVRRHGYTSPVWQTEFFDHVLRSSESYEAKWNYVRDNPQRAGLVEDSGDWPYQGELHQLLF